MRVEHMLAAMQEADKAAIIEGERQTSYRRWYQLSAALGSSIQQLGIAGNVGLFLPNCTAYLVGYLGILQARCTMVPLEVDAKRETLEAVLDYCDIAAVVTTAAHLPTITRYYRGPLFCLTDDGEMADTVPVRNGFVAPVMCCGAEVAIMLHTSGTTSAPKRVMLTHQNLLADAAAVNSSLQPQHDDVSLVVLPMCLSSGHMQVLTHLLVGATLVLFHGLAAPAALWAAICTQGITNSSVVPFMLQVLLTERFGTLEDTALRWLACSAGVLPAALAVAFKDRYPGIGLFNAYGQTEASPRISHLDDAYSVQKAGSIGRPLPGISIRVVDDSGADCAPKVRGELLVKGPNVMKGYYKNEPATRQALAGGWLHTGDIAYLDEDGFLYLVGRKKNIIIYGGRNIYPEMIEELLRGFDGATEVLIRGECRADTGDEVPVADVVPAPGEKFDERAFWQYCRDHLESYQMPQRVQLVPQLKKTANGKVLRH